MPLLEYCILIALRISTGSVQLPSSITPRWIERALPALAGQLTLEPALVKLERQGGLELWTVRAHDCSVRALLARVAELFLNRSQIGAALQ